MKKVILLTIDTLRKDFVGSKLTPFMDSIQDKSIQFTNAYSGGPYTQAGFPAILSSSYYLDFGRPKGKCPPQRKLISEILKENGITTAGFHSNAYLASFFGWNKGWDTYYDSMDANVSEKMPYIPAWDINKKAKGWLEKNSDKDNFFLWVHYMDVHEPYMAWPEYMEKIDPNLKISQDEQFRLFKEVVLKRDTSDPETIDTLRKLYSAKVLEMDAAAKELFGILKNTGNDDAVVIITADHGDEFTEHGGLSHDGKLYDELTNVPLIIYNAPKDQGKEVDRVVSTVDIPPTITNLFGVDPYEKWEGYSLLPLEEYARPAGVWAESIDKQGSHEKGDEPEVHMYREGHLKIIYRQGPDEWQMFDLEKDPEEKNNIAGDDSTTEYMKKQILPRVERYKK